MSSPGFAIASIQVSLGQQSSNVKFLFSEPIGSAKPKFGEDSDLKGMTRQEKIPAALLCPAQGYPLPAFRFASKYLKKLPSYA